MTFIAWLHQNSYRKLESSCHLLKYIYGCYIFKHFLEEISQKTSSVISLLTVALQGSLKVCDMKESKFFQEGLKKKAA